MDFQSAIRDPRSAIQQQLRSLQLAGVSRLIVPSAPEAAPTVTDASQTAPPPAAAMPTRTLFDSPHPEPIRSLPDREKELVIMQEEVCRCTCCAELVANRTQTVFGVGNPLARLCFLGEAPGMDEDRQGIPFVGRSGQLLNDILKACTLRREDVYICNVLKCRPPENRTPAQDEVSNCRHFFERQLELIQPEFICCLGSVAATTLLNTKQSLAKLRGRFHTWRSSRVIVTYHPSYLLRTPSAKRDTWEDMKMLMREMGVDLG